MKITSSTGALSFAPVGTDPRDTGAWANIGHLVEDALTFDPAYTDPEPVKAWSSEDMVKSMADIKTTLTLHTKFPSPDALSSMFSGIPIYESPAIPPSSMMLFSATRGGYALAVSGVKSRPFTDLEREGEWAKRTVRHGLTKALPWLRMNPGPEPDKAYTDYLMKMSMVAHLAGAMT